MQPVTFGAWGSCCIPCWQGKWQGSPRAAVSSGLSTAALTKPERSHRSVLSCIKQENRCQDLEKVFPGMHKSFTLDKLFRLL